MLETMETHFAYVNTETDNIDTIQLTSSGNNDDGVSDWEAIPEF